MLVQNLFCSNKKSCRVVVTISWPEAAAVQAVFARVGICVCTCVPASFSFYIKATIIMIL